MHQCVHSRQWLDWIVLDLTVNVTFSFHTALHCCAHVAANKCMRFVQIAFECHVPLDMLLKFDFVLHIEGSLLHRCILCICFSTDLPLWLLSIHVCQLKVSQTLHCIHSLVVLLLCLVDNVVSDRIMGSGLLTVS